MKILFATGIYPPEIGGPATFVVECAEALQRLGHVVEIVTYGDDRTVAGRAWKVWKISRAGGPLIRYLRYAWRVFIQARKADLVFAQGAVSEGFPATLGAWFARKPVVMRIPGDYAWEMAQQHGETDLLDAFLTKKHRGVIRIYERIERWTASRAKQIIVPSAYLKRVAEAWGVASDNIDIVYSSVAAFPLIDAPASRPEGAKKVLLTVVRAVPWKGVDFLLRVLRTLPEEIFLVVAGDGPYLNEWKKIAMERGVDRRCIFLGRTDRKTLATWYAAADAFVLASGYEGFPHVVPEAISFGLPCIVSDRGGNPETRELFPDHVQVLPYEEQHAWERAFALLPERKSPIVFQDFSVPATKIEIVLKSVCAS